MPVSSEYRPMPNGEEFWCKLINDMALYPTGLKCMDELLDGGVMNGELVEICGPVASGKTQFALTFCSKMIEHSQGRVLYVDTSGGFSAFRFGEICLSQNPKFTKKDLQNHLTNLIYTTAVTVTELMEVLEGIKQNLNNVRKDLKAVVIDHVGTLLSALVPRDRYAGFNQMMFASRLMKIICKEYNLVIIVINQRIKFGEKPAKPALGQWWTSFPDLVVLFGEQSENRITEAKVIKSSRYLRTSPKMSSIRFRITSKGTCDVD